MDNTFIPKGMEIVKAAVIADNADEHEKAFALYKQGLQYFMTGLKYMKNEKSKAAIREKMGQYMDRAEQIKTAIEKKDKKQVVKAGVPASKDKAAKASGGGGKDESDKPKEDDDPDNAKLQAALATAIVRETPNVKWDDVAGLDQAKTLLKEAVILPIKFPQLFTGKRKPWKGILLYGPPGTGKSYLAKAVSTEAGSSCFLSVSSADLVSKYQGESERLVKQLFELARKNQPSIVFIDEIDSLCSSRGDGENESGRRIKTEFLVQMQGVGTDNKGVLVLGATNTPWELDPAIRRRFEKRVYIPLPELQARNVLFSIHIGNTPHELKPADFKALAAKTDGFSGADISVLVRDALMEPVRICQSATHFKKVLDKKTSGNWLYEPCSPGDSDAEEMQLMAVPSDKLHTPDVSVKHFEAVLKKCKATVGKEDLKKFEDWTKQYGQEG